MHRQSNFSSLKRYCVFSAIRKKAKLKTEGGVARSVRVCVFGVAYAMFSDRNFELLNNIDSTSQMLIDHVRLMDVLHIKD